MASEYPAELYKHVSTGVPVQGSLLRCPQVAQVDNFYTYNYKFNKQIDFTYAF